MGHTLRINDDDEYIVKMNDHGYITNIWFDCNHYASESDEGCYSLYDISKGIEPVGSAVNVYEALRWYKEQSEIPDEDIFTVVKNHVDSKISNYVSSVNSETYPFGYADVANSTRAIEYLRKIRDKIAQLTLEDCK